MATASLEELVGRIADEFLERLDRGERPEVEDYARRYPEAAAVIRQVFPALEVIRRPPRDGTALCEGIDLPSPAGCLGDFRIVREIGRGGMGIVYEAQQVSLGRRVALKVLPLAAALDSKQLQRFQLEAQAAACLHHTNIVPVHAVGCERGVPFYAMEYIDGCSLAQLIAELRRLDGQDRAEQPPKDFASISAATLAAGLLSGSFSRTGEPAGQTESGPNTPPAPSPTSAPPGTADAAARGVEPGNAPSSGSSTRSRAYVRAVAQFGVQVAEALDHAHTRGILHRDIKPGNVLLDARGQLWITDFGLAQVQGSPCLTLTGDILGTLRYMSPEQALAKRVVIDGRTDIYSLGVTLYEMLTLHPAVDGQDRQEILRKIAEDEPAPVRKLNATAPRDLETVLLKAMAKEPGGRYATAKDMADELRRFLEDKPIKARRPSLLDQSAKLARRHGAAVVTGLGGLLVAVAILAAGIGWIASDRTARLEVTEREVNRALDEAALLQAQAKWPEALEIAKRAEGILAAGASEDLRRRVWEVRNDVAMVLRLEEVWMPHEARVGAADLFSPQLAAAYANAFREFGIDVEFLEPSVAAARIRARKIRLELALALDLWARAHLGSSQECDSTWRRLVAVARAADPDEWRNRMREALEHRDDKALNELADSAQSSDLPMQTLSLLITNPRLDTKRQLSLLRQAQQAHPDNFQINFQLAWGLDFAPPPNQNQDEAIRFYTAALALRPRNASTCFWLANALGARGRADEQIAYYRKAVALDPNFLRAFWALSYTLLARGRRDEAIAVLRKAGHSTSNDPNELNSFAWCCATSRFSELRDPPRAVELAQKAVELAPQTGGYWNTLGVAQYRAENWSGAIAGFERSMALRRGGDSFDWFFLAMTAWQLGDHDEARQWYDRAVLWMDEHNPNDKELRRFRAEAAELLRIKDRAQSETKKGLPEGSIQKVP